MVISHRRAPIGHRTVRIILCDLIKTLEGSYVPKVMQKSQCPVEINAYLLRAGGLHMSPSQALLRTSGQRLVASVLREQYHRQGTGTENSENKGFHWKSSSPWGLLRACFHVMPPQPSSHRACQPTRCGPPGRRRHLQPRTGSRIY